MCGGFAGIAAHSSKPRYAQLSYHFGRLITYIILGFFGGYFGEVVNHFGNSVGIHRTAALLTGGTMILLALASLVGRSFKVSRFLPASLMHLPTRLISHSPKSTVLRGLSLGLFSTLLPCGWLYTYVALAAASANALSGIFIMFVFWLGTLPILLTIGSISHLLSNSLRKRIPVIVAILMLFAGFFTMSEHLDVVHRLSNGPVTCTPDMR